MPLARSAGLAFRSTILNSSRAVWPSSSLSACGSLRPGTWTTMRSSPWRTIVGSRVPSALTRRSTMSRAASIALLMKLRVPASVGVMMIRVESRTSISQSRSPDRPAPCVWLLSRSRASSILVPSRTIKANLPPARLRPPIAIFSLLPRSPRSTVRIVFSIASSRCLRTSSISASSMRWLPPARSRPRLIRALGIQEGNAETTLSGSMLGTASAMPKTSSSVMPMTFQRGNSSIILVLKGGRYSLVVNRWRVWRPATRHRSASP